jgi:hypothetical protein
MSTAILALTRCERSWKELVEAGVFETDAPNLSQRIQDAQNAVMDEIEDSFQTASPTERQSLINAMNTVRELRCGSQNAGWKSEDKLSNSSNA